MKWTTFKGNEVDTETVSHQHLSNAIWYWRVLFSYPDSLLTDLIEAVTRRFGQLLPYRPHIEFHAEVEMLERRGFIRRINGWYPEIWWKGNRIGEIIYPKSQENTSLMDKIVTKENAKVGDRVVRGPGWRFMSQDCDIAGFPTKGTITKVSDSNWISVIWDGGRSDNYPGDGNLAFDSPSKKDTMSNIIVTMGIAYLGMRVRRGPKWTYGTQDCDSSGNQMIGSIISISSSAVQVRWDKTGYTAYYYITGDKQDLYFDNSGSPAPKNTTGAPYGPTPGSTDPYKQLSSYKDVKVSDTVKCVNTDYYYGVESGLVIGQEYRVTNNNEGTLDIAGKTYCIGIGNFALVPPDPNKRPVLCGEVMDWAGCRHLIVKGMQLKCVYVDAYCRYDGIKAGDVVEVIEVNSTANAVMIKRGSYWIDISRFDLASKGAINMSSIYSQIKTKKDESDRHTGSTNRSIQVQRPVAAIRRTERESGRGFRCGRSKATIAK